MRPIKFRAWDKNCKCFVWFTLQELIKNSNDKDITICLDDMPLQQFTGLHDKNGKEIYEGDIVKRSDDILYKVTFQNGIYVGEMITTKNCLLKEKYPLLSHLVSTSEVIGNIYDTKEDL